MRWVWCTAAAIALLYLVSVTDARADTWTLEAFQKKLTHSEWEGCGVGTVIHKKMTRTRVSEEGEEEVRVRERRVTVVEVTDTKVKLEKEWRDGPDEEWESYDDEEDRVKDRRLEIEDAGTETLVVGDVEYECQVKHMKAIEAEGGEVRETFRVWVHPEKGILKLAGGEENFSLTLTLTSFDEPVTIGERQLPCVAYAVKGEGGDEKAEGQVLLSTQVPGDFVRYTMNMAEGEGRTSSQVEEVIAFEKK